MERLIFLRTDQREEWIGRPGKYLDREDLRKEAKNENTISFNNIQFTLR
mgnify:CR=1 FL=1